jgi:hypothetical protein
MNEIERLQAFLDARQITYKDLARQMKWSPAFVYGALGGSWALSDSFRWAFARTFGLAAAGQVFGLEPTPCRGEATSPLQAA